MKFRSQNPRISKNKMPILLFITALLVVPLSAAVAEVAEVSAPANLIANFNLGSAVFPMGFNITGIQVVQVGGQNQVVVNLLAYNNLGLEATYPNSTVNLQSLILVLTYSYQSGFQEVQGVLNAQPRTNLILTSDENTPLAIQVTGLLATPGTCVQLNATGTYTWQMNTNTHPTDTVVNGKGNLTPTIFVLEVP